MKMTTKNKKKALAKSRYLWRLACADRMRVAVSQKKRARQEIRWPNPFAQSWKMSAVSANSERTEEEIAAEALARAQIPNARLRELAQSHRPPADWYEGDEEDLF
jgi:hypothetical protein